MNRVYPPVSGATGRMLRDLARSFAREGWQVTVITTGPKAGLERDGSIRIIRLKGPAKPGGFLGYGWLWLKMLVAALRQPASHLLVTMSDPPLLVLAGQIVKRFKKNRHIHWCQDLYPDILPALGVRVPYFMMSFFKRLNRRALSAADKVIVIGRCMAKHLTYEEIDPKHITVIPNWPDFELMEERAANDANGANGHHGNGNGAGRPVEELLKSGPRFRVLYAGNIGMAHPIQTILEAARILHDEHPEIEFVFVGDGPRYDELARERSRLGLDNIRLMPFQPASKLKELMESGDVHLISMKEEAAGMLVPSKLYAALAVARPCVFIGPAQSETAKVITDFNAGVIVPQGEAQVLAERILHYRENGEEWFSAHQGAAEAGKVFVPGEAINAWIERAWSVVKTDIAV